MESVLGLQFFPGIAELHSREERHYFPSIASTQHRFNSSYIQDNMAIVLNSTSHVRSLDQQIVSFEKSAHPMNHTENLCNNTEHQNRIGPQTYSSCSPSDVMGKVWHRNLPRIWWDRWWPFTSYKQSHLDLKCAHCMKSWHVLRSFLSTVGHARRMCCKLPDKCCCPICYNIDTAMCRWRYSSDE